MKPEETTEFPIEREPGVIYPEVLAAEMALKEWRFPEETYESADRLIALIYDKIIIKTYQMTPEEMGQYFVQHKAEIFSYFESFSQSYRLPLLLREQSFTLQALEFAKFNGIEPKVSFDAFFYCMHFYLHLITFRNAKKLAQKHPKGQPVFSLQQLVQDEMESELLSAWGNKSAYFFAQMFPDEIQRRDLGIEELGIGESSGITRDQLNEYCKELIKFLRRPDVGPERILIDPLSRMKGVTFVDKSGILAEQDAEQISFLLCQNHLFLYEISFQKLLNHPDQYPAWQAWIKKHIQFLLKNSSQVVLVFKSIFAVRGNIFAPGGESFTREGRMKIPEILQETIIEARRVFRAEEKQRRRAEKSHKVVAQIPLVRPTQTSMAVLGTPLVQKEIVLLPQVNTIFPDLETSKASKKQLEKVDFSRCHFPEGTTISLERALPGKKQIFESLQVTDINGINSITPELGRTMIGHFSYRVTILLPSTHRFEGKNSIEVSYYAKAEPTPEEIEEQIRLLEALKDQPKGPEKTAPVVVEQVEKKVERVIDPVGVSLTAVAVVLEAKKDVYSEQEYSGGAIIIDLTDDVVDVLGDDAKAVLPEHKQWIITEDGAITPAVSDTDVKALLMSIVGTIRTRYQKEQQQREAELQQQREIEEYEKARQEFEPILSFAKAFRFEGREKGDFEAQKSRLRDELDGFGWSMPVALTNNQVIWRHKSVYIKILYASKMCSSFIVEAETKGNITPATQKCYEEVGEAFAHIARFFNAETRERKKMVTREQAIRKETETGAIAYEKLLAEGRARLVLYNPYQGSYGAWSSKFPTEKKPYMLDERASHATVTSLLEQYPHAELCYRRDQLCINGEIADDAGEESVENTLQNIADLRQSPRARYILTKRILITLGLEKFGGDTSRAPIKHEKNKKEGRLSALDILLALKQEKGVQTSADITEQFLDAYIDALETNRIRVHYTWPLSVRLDEHQKMIQKSAAVLAKPKSTAD